MSENKFIAQLKGNVAPGSVLEVQDKGSKTSFANMPSGTSDAIVTYSDKRNNATAVLKGAMNWKVNGSTLSVANPAGDGSDYTGQTNVAGISDQQGNNLWINASYTVPADGLFLTKNTKWVLKLCGDNLIVNGGDTAEFTVLITAGNSTNITKKFYVGEQANQFCKELVIDFAESNTSTVKLEPGDTITLKLLSDIPNASARIYQGMTTLTLLQRAVDAENVISNDGSYEDIWEEINKKVNIDGSSIMSGPLKFRAGSFVGAIAGGLGDGISFYKLKNDNTIDSEVASLTKTNGFTPGTTNTMNIGSSSLKWKDLYVARVIASVLNNGANISVPTTGGTMALTSDIKNSTVSVQLDGSAVDSFTLNQSSNKTINIPAANKDLSNLTSTGANIGNWSSNVTNCITEIPQDINLTLSSAGQLKLLAGSKLYIPNGAGVFTEKTTTSDATRAASLVAGQYVEIALYNKADLTFSQLFEIKLSKVCSGTTDTLAGQSQHLWYDTTNNLIKYYGNDGVTNSFYAAFPLCIISTNGSQITSIDQVFNGFGYIGSTTFTLPGVKGLIPDGRNTDGTLKNTVMNVTAVQIRTYTGTAEECFFLNVSGLPGYFTAISVAYDAEKNINYRVSNNEKLNNGIFGVLTLSSGQITSFSPKYAFHAVDYIDSEYIAHCSTPSGRYVDLTLPDDNRTITAPADGYMVFHKAANAAGQRIGLTVNTGARNIIYSSAANQYMAVTIPVQKGNLVTINHTAGGETTAFRFIYANGAK